MFKIIYISCAASILFFVQTSMADVVVLKNGMVLNGKVIEKSGTTITFISYHGKFTIEQNLITKLHITYNPEDEIKILEKMEKAPDRMKIEAFYKREDVKARIKEEKKQQLAEKKKEREENSNEIPNSDPKRERPSFDPSRLNISTGPAGYSTIGEYRSVIPWGYGLSAIADIRLSDIIVSGKSSFIPELMGEFSYLRFEKGPVGFQGFLIAAGPVWFFPLLSHGKFFGAFLMGEGAIALENNKTGYAKKENIHIMLMTVGFPFQLGSVELIPRARYIFINDAVPFHCLGFGIFARFRFF